MAASASTSRPNWQRNAVFEFFASLKLAVILLAVLIGGAITGTLYESSFDAKVAGAILRDPGWLLKWIGSLLIVSGIFMLFYVKQFRRPEKKESAPPRPRELEKRELVSA